MLRFATLQPNNRKAELPTECYSLTFTPEGKAKLLTAGYVVNRFEGNTRGLGAVLALFENAGLPQMADVTENACGVRFDCALSLRAISVLQECTELLKYCELSKAALTAGLGRFQIC